jgi:hypothetical protein
MLRSEGIAGEAEARGRLSVASRAISCLSGTLSGDPAELNLQALACWRSELDSDPMHLPGVQDGTAPAGRGFRLAACNFAFGADRCSFLGEDPPARCPLPAARCPLPATECGSDDGSRSSNNPKGNCHDANSLGHRLSPAVASQDNPEPTGRRWWSGGRRRCGLEGDLAGSGRPGR